MPTPMTPAAPGVFRRDPNTPRPPKYRRTPEPQGPFHEEAADAEMRAADERKWLANRLRPR
jgi:hypothetical protein